MRALKRTIAIVVGLAALLWISAASALLIFQRDLIYPFVAVDARRVVGVPGAEVAHVAAPDGVDLIAWVARPAPGRPIILYFTGNSGSLPHSAPRLAEFALRGYGLAALNYRGAGGAEGMPSEEALIADGLALYDQLPHLFGANGPPVIYGTSLGAAVAVQVAARRPARAVVLETPFARLCETAEHHYSFLPACALARGNRWDSIDMIGAIEAPLLIQHGDSDSHIPLAQARRLFDAAKEPKRLMVYPGGNHNDLRLFGAGADAIAWLAGD